MHAIFRSSPAPALVHGADAVAGLLEVVAHEQILLHALTAHALMAVLGAAVLRLLLLPDVLHLARPVVDLRHTPAISDHVANAERSKNGSSTSTARTAPAGQPSRQHSENAAHVTAETGRRARAMLGGVSCADFAQKAQPSRLQAKNTLVKGQ